MIYGIMHAQPPSASRARRGSHVRSRWGEDLARPALLGRDSPRRPGRAVWVGDVGNRQLSCLKPAGVQPGRAARVGDVGNRQLSCLKPAGVEPGRAARVGNVGNRQLSCLKPARGGCYHVGKCGDRTGRRPPSCCHDKRTSARARRRIDLLAGGLPEAIDLRGPPHAKYGCDEYISFLAGAGRSERLRVAIVPRGLSAQEILRCPLSVGNAESLGLWSGMGRSWRGHATR